MKLQLFLAAFILQSSKGDVAMHNPRGSNNKLNEQQNNVRNNRRLFDSQDNDNIGYQVGDKCVPNCYTDETTSTYDPTKPGAGEGVMEFYEGSELPIQWTNQHGCGANSIVHCNVVIQYACEDHPYFVGLRDGTTTDKIPDDNYTDPQYGQHETKQWWDMCATRERNKGLFTADQNLNGLDTAIHTRQDTNNNNNRFGFECPEERDYYPYWLPTGWRDIWVGTDETFRCQYFQSNSENVARRGNCSNPFYNNEQQCTYNGATWTWVDPHNVPPPDCGLAPTTRNNHLGNADGTSDFPTYLWTIPRNVHADGTKCVLRIRYNISSYDFDGWSTFKQFNNDNSPVKGNPSADWLNLGQNISGPLRLAINTDQYPRTFQDRSHVFKIRKLPSSFRGWLGQNRIINLNVRGRRGNIQQTFPAIEYDFVPNKIQASRGDYLHIQWVGSDANDQGNAGQGRTGTDRHNIVLMAATGKNFPLNLRPAYPAQPPLHFTNDVSKIAYMAFVNQTDCNPDTTITTQDPGNCRVLNRAPGTVNVGLVRIDNPGTFAFFSTRNNQFTNREQKGTLTVSEDWATVGGATAISVSGVGISAALVFFFFVKRPQRLNRHSSLKDPLVGEFDDDVSEYDDGQTQAPKKIPIGERYPFIGRLQEWYEWEAHRIRFVAGYALVNIAVWIYGYAANVGKSPAPFYPYAKGFGKTLDVNVSFMLIPVLRNFLSFLRTTPAGGLLPLDDNILIHKLTAYLIVAGAAGHIACHYADFIWLNDHRGQWIVNNALGTVPGFTGHVIVFLMLLMFATAMIKRKVSNFFGKRFDGYHLFLKVHKLWIPVFVLMWFHSANFWPFSLWPLAFMLVEKFIQSRRARLDVQLVEASLVGKDVLCLKMRLSRKGKKFRFKAGQYMFLNCPPVSETEWHPFTITSAPEDPYFSCHIRCRSDMDWTYRLRQRLGFADRMDANGNTITARKEPLTENEKDLIPSLKVDGPYGSASEEVFDHSVVVLVGAGIGVTPFVSVLKSISIRMKTKTAEENEKITIYFYWICRDQVEFDSFKDLFDDLMANPQLSSCLEVNTYTTGEMNLKKIKMEKYNQFSGKPNWNRIFKEKAQKHKGEQIGVFLCGPNAIAAELNMACKKNSDKIRPQSEMPGGGADKTVFKFHKENF